MRLCRPHEPEPILLGAGMRSFVRIHRPFPESRKPEGAKKPLAHDGPAILDSELLFVIVESRRTVAHEGPFGLPQPVIAGGAGIFVLRRAVTLPFQAEVDPDDVPEVTQVEPILLFRGNHIVRRGNNLGQVAHFIHIVVDAPKRRYDGHVPTPSRESR